MKSPIDAIKLSKDYILEHVNQIDILSQYLSINTSDIIKCLDSKFLIKSPFRHDKRPSMGFHTGQNGMIYYQDFGRSYSSGDCFDAVARQLRLHTPLSGVDFMLVLEEIDEQFIKPGSRYYVNTQFGPRLTVFPTSEVSPIAKEYVYTIRNWSKLDKSYWGAQCISIDTCEKFNCFPISALYIDGKCVYRFSYSDPAYVYIFADDAVQFYFPFRDGIERPRFITTSRIVQNGRNVRTAKYGVITKSYKDVMFLDNYSEASIQAIAPPSEVVLLTPDQMSFIREHWVNVFTLTDFDRTGILFAERMKRLYNTIPLFLGNGNYNTIDFKAKDPTDFVTKHNKPAFNSLVSYFVSRKGIINNDEEFADHCYKLGFYKRNAIDDDLPF